MSRVFLNTKQGKIKKRSAYLPASLARTVQGIIDPRLPLYGPSAVTLGQYSPVRPPRSVGKKLTFKAFG